MIDDPKIPITCDWCGDEEAFPLRKVRDNLWSADSLDARMTEAGWITSQFGDDICPSCLVKAKNYLADLAVDNVIYLPPRT